MTSCPDTISIIIPIHNGGNWIDICFNAILNQIALNTLSIEICVCNDASSDNTPELLKKWNTIFNLNKIPLKIFDNSDQSGGVGFAKNKAVGLSSGNYLCFQDIDDIMLPDRILKQYLRACIEPDNTIIGCQYKRNPENSTIRYTKWANSLTPSQLYTQAYTSFGPTVIMPTWFCNKKVFDKVGGFVENKIGCPEDLIFFNKHLDMGGKICRVDEILLIYTYHPQCMTFSVNEETIWNIRVKRIENTILKNWTSFTIWNAGKQGRKFYNSLSEQSKNKVVALCDVDKNKIGKMYIPYNATERKSGRPVNIISYNEAKPPLIICVKLDLTQGIFEKLLKTLNLKEGTEYILFN